MFTVRELQLIHTLAANEAEDVRTRHLPQLEREGVTSGELLAYADELRAIAHKAQEAVAAEPPPIDPSEEDLYEPTAEDLAAIAAEFEETQPDDYNEALDA